jgi:DNA mismatch repair protein MLH3
LGHGRGAASEKRVLGNARPASRSRLSKEDLLSAQVLAQVDKKFILIRMRESDEANALCERSKDLLVLIDQHAADERIRVEQLLEELCSPVDTNCAYQSKLGHHAEVASVNLEKPLRFSVSQQEEDHFISHAAKFASWGILFDISNSMFVSEQHSRSSELCHLLVVTALPPSISERCKADTDLLVTFLRSTVWHYVSDPGVLSRIPMNMNRGASSWQERIATCPKGLLDMINSRACRSAIMFNDELDMSQCEELVQRLATCVFPFVCAHGRPSMVPLIDIPGLEDGMPGENSMAEANRATFVQSWKQWRQ